MRFSKEELRTELRERGYAKVSSTDMRTFLGAANLENWERFAASWNDLGVDAFMADGGRYRRRRFSAFSSSAVAVQRKPPQPHFQSQDFNVLNGGVERWFDPVTEEIAAHSTTLGILRSCNELFRSLMPKGQVPELWHIEMHQFRIEASVGEQGKPTPEGMHRDGVDWVLVLLVKRENVLSGETRLADLALRPIASFTLSEPLDACFVDDARVFHGVTPIEPTNLLLPAYRDVLVVTFRRQ